MNEERRKMLQIETKGTFGIKYVTIPTLRLKNNGKLLTKDEINMYKCLNNIYKNTNIKISTQVALNQIIEANTKRYYTEKKEECITNKFKGMSIDFILFNKDNSKILCCIELNGEEHYKEKNKIERDTFLKETFELLEIPIIFIKSRESYEENEIKEIINIEIKNK